MVFCSIFALSESHSELRTQKQFKAMDLGCIDADGVLHSPTPTKEAESLSSNSKISKASFPHFFIFILNFDIRVISFFCFEIFWNLRFLFSVYWFKTLNWWELIHKFQTLSVHNELLIRKGLVHCGITHESTSRRTMFLVYVMIMMWWKRISGFCEFIHVTIVLTNTIQLRSVDETPTWNLLNPCNSLSYTIVSYMVALQWT